MTGEFICNELGIDINDVLNIYPYGSRVYGTADEYSDHDFIIVYKRSLLPSGAFKDNAISNKNKMIQGTCYSRGGFIDAINNFQISALECIFLPEDQIVQKKFNFKINKFDKKALVKNIIKVASSSYHNAKLSMDNDNVVFGKKNIYHAIRILDFGSQVLDTGKIEEYDSMNYLKKEIDESKNFKLKRYIAMFNFYKSQLERSYNEKE